MPVLYDHSPEQKHLAEELQASPEYLWVWSEKINKLNMLSWSLKD